MSAPERLGEILTRLDVPVSASEQRDRYEQAYRRGFYQGACACAMAHDSGCTAEEIDNWLESVLFPWRCEKHKGVTKFPIWLEKKT